MIRRERYRNRFVCGYWYRTTSQLVTHAHTPHPALSTDLNPYQIAITAWAFATLSVCHDRLMAGLTLQALKPRVLGEFEPQNLANTLWSLATLNIQDQPVGLHPSLLHTFSN